MPRKGRLCVDVFQKSIVSHSTGIVRRRRPLIADRAAQRSNYVDGTGAGTDGWMMDGVSVAFNAAHRQKCLCVGDGMFEFLKKLWRNLKRRTEYDDYGEGNYQGQGKAGQASKKGYRVEVGSFFFWSSQG